MVLIYSYMSMYVNAIGRMTLSSDLYFETENELDGLSLRLLKDTDIYAMLPGKLGPARKLALLCDELKARHLQSTENTCSKNATEVHNLDQSCQLIQEKPNTEYCSGVTANDPIECSSMEVLVDRSEENASRANTNSDDLNIYIPMFSQKVKALLESGMILNEWDKFIEECAYHILSIGNFDTKEQYNRLGWLMHKKYPCIAFSGGKNEWTFFTTKLSQKIRNIRWKWNKRGKGDSIDLPGKRKKAPRKFDVEVEHNGPDEDSLTFEKAEEIIENELKKSENNQDKPLILKAMRKTFQTRRRYLQGVDGGNLKKIVEKYPILKTDDFIVAEFNMLKPNITREVLMEHWTEMLCTLDKVFEINKDSDEESHTVESNEIIKVLKRVQKSIKFVTKSRETLDLISEMELKDLNLSSKSKSAPRLIIIRNSNGSINNNYIVGDGIQICVGSEIQKAFEKLLMVYYVFDLTYPKCFQLLGFLQVAIFKDNAPFHRAAAFAKFEKQYLELRDSKLNDDVNYM